MVITMNISVDFNIDVTVEEVRELLGLTEEAPEKDEGKGWLEELLMGALKEENGTEASEKPQNGLSENALSSILRVIPTCKLVWELEKREGVETHIAGPYQDVTVTQNGPATILVVTD